MIIGFNGKMGAGKSTAVECLHFLAQQQNQEISLVKLAQPLYDMQEFIYRRISKVYARPETFVKDRKLLQWLGSNWGRDTIAPDLWVNLWKATALQQEQQGFLVVCDDVRFDNEAEAIKSLGGLVVKIERKDAAQAAQGGEGIKGHDSESGISPSLVDFIIENNGTKSEYQTKLINKFSYHFLTANKGVK